MSLDGISGFHQEGLLWLPNQSERKGKENINFSEEFRKEQIRQRVKDRIAKMPQPQLTTEAQAAYDKTQKASNAWTQNRNLVPSQPKKLGGAIKKSKQAMYDRLFDAQKTSTSPIFPTKDADQYGKMLEQNPVMQSENPIDPAAQKKPYEKPITTTRPVGQVVVGISEQDNVKNTKPSRQERLREIRNNPEKRARYNKLKLAQNPELKTRYERFSKFKKTKGLTGGLKKAGKWGAVAALVIGAGALLLNKCSGKDEKPVVAEKPVPTEEEPAKPAQPVVEEQTEPAEEEPAKPAQPVVEEQTEPAEETEPVVPTENIIQNGDTLEEVANRYGITVDKLKELNADKIKQFQTVDGRVIEGFLVSEEITLPENVKKVDGLRNKDEAIADYEKELIENFENIPQAMWNQVCTPEFRKKHKLGEYKEAA